MTRSRHSGDALLCAGCAAAGALLYAFSGAVSAFLAADDFDWMHVARVAGWRHVFVVAGRSHFYRPVAEAWFAAMTPACGYRPACFHTSSVILHGINVGLFACLAFRLSRRMAVAVLAGLVFASLPGYAEAVVWVSAVTILLGAYFWLIAAHLALTAAQRDSGFWWTGAGAAAALAMFSHESAASILLLLPVLLLILERRPIAWWFEWRRAVPFAAAAALFAWAAVVANRRNYVFTEGHYTPGPHAIGNALDYLVALYVGPHSVTGFGFIVLLLGVSAIAGDRLMRIGVAWTLIAMIPYLGFTWGNVSRYLYLSSMGFALLVAALLLAARDALEYTRPRAGVIAGVTALVAAAVLVRFGVFTVKAVHDRRTGMEAYRSYSDVISSTVPRGRSVVTVHAPADPRIEPGHIESQVRWTLRDPYLQVITLQPR